VVVVAIGMTMSVLVMAVAVPISAIPALNALTGAQAP
jgi:hypothetical protein